MTREEAIECLTSLLEVRRKYGDLQTMRDEIESLQMAIQALTAISELSKRLKAVNRYDMDEKVLIGFNMAVAIFNECFGEICALKNEQPEQNVGMCQQNVGEMSEKQTDGDLISRDYTIQQIQKAKENNYNFNYNTLLDFIKVLPSAEKTDGDLISRQAVLDIISDVMPIYSDNYHYILEQRVKDLPSAEKTESEKLDDIIVRVEVQNIYNLLTRHTALLNDIKMMLPSEKTAEWISVRKQKPEDYEEVIATVRYDYGNKQEYEVVTGVRYSKEDGWEWTYEAGADYWESINGVVVAWKPLPKPYEVKR